jgi:hypothetical protein
LEEFNEQEPEIEADIDWEEELEDHEYEVGNDPFLMNNEEAEQFLFLSSRYPLYQRNGRDTVPRPWGAG